MANAGVTADLQCAAQILAEGGLVAHATEGVWGIACDPFRVESVQRLLRAKQRAASMGLIVIAADPEAFAEELALLREDQRQEVLNSWPGPNTWVLPTSRFPEHVTGGRETQACRVPDHAQARALCATFGGPLVSTSANKHGEPAPLTEQQARAQIGALVDMVLPGEVGLRGQASTIRTLDGEQLR